MRKIFIGISIAQEIKDEIKIIQFQLSKSEFFKGSFIRAENLHLTLKYLGELEDDSIFKIQKDLRKIVFEPIKLQSKELNFFSHELIKVIWIGFDSDIIGLEVLKYKIDKTLEWLDVKEKTSFLSHLTIARVKVVENKGKLEQLISEIKVKKLDLLVDHFSLLSSELTNNGPVYTNLETYWASQSSG